MDKNNLNLTQQIDRLTDRVKIEVKLNQSLQKQIDQLKSNTETKGIQLTEYQDKLATQET